MLGQEPPKTVKQTEVKQKPPFVVSNVATVTPGRTARPQEVIISPAVKQLNKDGYIIYNTPEKEDIYITVQPETAFFDDEEPQMVRMAGGSFVGNKRSEPVVMPVRREAEVKHIEYSQPADIFFNAKRREAEEDIDYSEVIIKKNDSFESEMEDAPVLFNPGSYKDIIEPVLEETFQSKKRVKVAATSSEAMEMAMPKDFLTGYNAEPEYEVQDVTAPTEDKMVTETPAGMYVEGNKPIDIAKAGDDETDVISAFMGNLAEEEAAVTSEAMPMTEVAMPLIPDTQMIEAAKEPVPEMSLETASETVTDAAECINETEYVMKLTVPSLRMFDDLFAEMSKEMEIPDDGLEAYDCKFRDAPVRVAAICNESLGSEGNESMFDMFPFADFRFE